jgi:hypothetical protein
MQKKKPVLAAGFFLLGILFLREVAGSTFLKPVEPA